MRGCNMFWTKKSYWHDTYEYEYQSKVIDIGIDPNGEHWITLSETIFHPQGGGQPSDIGSINGIEVFKVREERLIEKPPEYDFGKIKHYVKNKPNFSNGSMVTLKINKEKRLEFSALHTAGHIIGGIMRTKYGYVQQMGANHFPSESRVEFKKDGDDFQTSNLNCAVDEINLQKKIVSSNYQESPEIYKQLGRDSMTRCVTIDGLWTEPCSGTHLNTTGEVSNFLIRSIKIKKGKISVGYNANKL